MTYNPDNKQCSPHSHVSEVSHNPGALDCSRSCSRSFSPPPIVVYAPAVPTSRLQGSLAGEGGQDELTQPVDVSVCVSPVYEAVPLSPQHQPGGNHTRTSEARHRGSKAATPGSAAAMLPHITLLVLAAAGALAIEVKGWGRAEQLLSFIARS